VFFNITNHAYARAKQRLNEKIISNYKNLTFFQMESELNKIITKSNNSVDKFKAKNNSIWFRINNSNLFIITREDIIITIKQSSVNNLINNV